MLASQGPGIHNPRNTLAASKTPCCSQRSFALRGPLPARRDAVIRRASDKAATLLVEGKRKYEAGDRMGALNIYEQALAEGAALSQQQRLGAMYGVLAVHASFGDVELAQMTLRDAIQAGLDYEAALADPDMPEINSSPQILIQLGRFNKQLRRTMSERAEDSMASNIKAKAAAKRMGGSSSRVGADADMSRLLGPGAGQTNELGIDASPAAIAKRVALVLLAGIALGVVLFFAGLEYMFPKI